MAVVVAIRTARTAESTQMSSPIFASAVKHDMNVRSFDPDRLGRTPSVGRAYLYVLPCRYENILKLGFSRDPLERMAAFHPRYFEFFDLNRAFAIELDKVSEARRMERYLAAPLHEHRAPAPLLVRDAAAGHTEWYRGAYSLLEQQGRRAQHEGHILHLPLKRWVRDQLEIRSALLFDWSQRMLDEITLDTSADGLDSAPLHRTLNDAVDALVALKLQPERFVPATIIEWRASLPSTFAKSISF